MPVRNVRDLVCRVSTTVSIMGVVLVATLCSVIAVAFSGTIFMLLGIAAGGFVLGFMVAVGLILKIKQDPMTSYNLLVRAETKALESYNIINAAIIDKMVDGGAKNGETEGPDLAERPGSSGSNHTV